MTTATATRRLAAIFAADVVGYSRLMGAVEEGTHERSTAKAPAPLSASSKICGGNLRRETEAKIHLHRYPTFFVQSGELNDLKLLPDQLVSWV